MKKFISIGLLLSILTAFAACSAKIYTPALLAENGIAPYELSESERYILQSFGMEGNSQIISFNAPKEAISMNVNVRRLEGDGSWSDIGGGAISIGADREPVDSLVGTLTIQLGENHAIDFNINTSGQASFSTDQIILDTEIMASAKGFLQEFQEIEIGKEIPVALMVYDSGTSMRAYSLQDYFEPSKFEGKDLVQVITVTFSDKEL